MQGSMLYSKLQQFFPNDIENINFGQLSSNMLDHSHSLSYLISSSLPHLSLSQIHAMCRSQQKNVMEKIIQIKQFDLYQEIANVCPGQKDLRNMPTQEVTMKINHYTSKMILEQRVEQESEEEQLDYYQQQSSKMHDDDLLSMVHPIQLEEMHYQIPDNGKGLRNIFQQYDNNHMPWNQMCIYDLN